MDLRISELTELSSLNDDDYLVLQQNSNAGKQSYKIKFMDFKSQFQSKFKDIGVKSAAYCNAAQFSPFAHGHDYSDIWYFPSYGPDSQNIDKDNGTQIGKFNVITYGPGIDNSTITSIDAWQPQFQHQLINEISAYNKNCMHKVGDLQLLAVKNFYTYLTSYRKYNIINSNIDINPSNDYVFDGFVIPNGQTFSCAYDKFKSACKMYSSSHNENATSFTVPDLTNTFFKCDPGLPASQMQPLAKVASTNGLPAHTHGSKAMSSNPSQTLELPPIQFTVRGTHNAHGTSRIQFKNSVHYSTPGMKASLATSFVNSDQVSPRLMDFSLTCDMGAAPSCSSTGDSGEVYPSHAYVQLLLYIGMPDD